MKKLLSDGTDEVHCRDLYDPPIDHYNQLIYRTTSKPTMPLWGSNFVVKNQKEMVTFTITGKNHFQIYDIVKKGSSPLIMNVSLTSDFFRDVLYQTVINKPHDDILFGTPGCLATMKVSILCEDCDRIEEFKVRTYPTSASMQRWPPGLNNGDLRLSENGTYLVYGALCYVDGRLVPTKIREENEYVSMKMLTIRYSSGGTNKPVRIVEESKNHFLHSVIVLKLD
jgi:hypothetical protein